MDIICINGEFLPLENAHVSATDAGILQGDGVFETVRVERGQLLLIDDHFARLARGLRVLEIPYHLEKEQLLAMCHQVIDANHLKDARLRITITRGPVRNQPITAQEGEPTLIITATRLDPRTDETRTRGWRIVMTPYIRNHRSPLASIKSTSYLESLMARRFAQRAGFDDGILLNSAGYVAETSIANLYLLRDNIISTPRIEDGALPGIMRGQLSAYCSELGLEFHEQTLIVEDFLAADEVFATNAMMQIMPVVQIGERQISDGQPGARTRQLFHLHRHMMDQYIQQNTW